MTAPDGLLAAMADYLLRPIHDDDTEETPPMPEPYRDPDGPIHAMLAAANAVAPRCRLEEGTALVHARYQYPPCAPEATPADVKAATDRYRSPVQRMWDAVTGREDTQADYLGVQ